MLKKYFCLITVQHNMPSFSAVYFLFVRIQNRPYKVWATSSENLFMSYANNKDSVSVQSDQHLCCLLLIIYIDSMDCIKWIWYLSPMRAAKVQASLRIRAVSPEPSLPAHTSSESRGTFRQKARSLAPLNGLACAVKMCHDGMLEDTNSLHAARIIPILGQSSDQSPQKLR